MSEDITQLGVFAVIFAGVLAAMNQLLAMLRESMTKRASRTGCVPTMPIRGLKFTFQSMAGFSLSRRHLFPLWIDH